MFRAIASRRRPVDMQLHADRDGVRHPLGRLVGSIRFGTDNSRFRLALTSVRPTAGTAPVLRVYVNGSLHRLLPLPDRDREMDLGFTYDGMIQTVTLRFGAILNDGSIVRQVTAGATYAPR